jgi:cell division protein FtsL
LCVCLHLVRTSAVVFSVRILTDKYEHAAEVAALQAKLEETTAELEMLKRSVPAASQGTRAAKQQAPKGVTPQKPKGPALI